MSQDYPKVSVIIPVYNTEKYLRECLDSVVNQTLKDIEIICVDDGSTDGSLEILREYEAKDGRVRVLTQPNSGSGPARNNGIISARGEFVAFMDADDYYPEDATLSLLFCAAKEHCVAICGGSLSTVNSDGSIKNNKGWGYAFSTNGEVKYADYQFDYAYQRFIYQRQFIIDNGIFFPPYLRFQDPPFFVKAMITAEHFYAVHDVTYRYRWDGPRSITSSEQKIRDSIYGYIDVLRLAKENKLWRLYRLSVNRCYKDNWNVLCEAEKSRNPEIQEALKSLDALIELPLWNDKITYLYKFHYIREKSQYSEILSSTSYKVGRGITWLPREMRSAIRYVRKHIQYKRK